MNRALHQIDQRAFRHDVADGLTEIAMALVFLVVVVIWHNPAFTWMTILPILVFGPVLRKIRARTTYPRIGYVKPKGEKPADLFRGMALYVLAVVAVVSLAAYLWRGQLTAGIVRQTLPLVASLLFGGGLLYAAGRSGLRRYYALCAVSVSLGAGLTLAALPGPDHGLEVYLVAMAAICFLSGLATFVVFVMSHPLRNLEEAADGESNCS